MGRVAWVLLLAGAADAQSTPVVSSLVLDHPCAAQDAHFGHSCAVLEMDAQGRAEIAVGAFGQSAVYVFHGAAPGFDDYEQVRTYTSSGPALCPAPNVGDRFGWIVVGGQLDGDVPEELVVGAPRADLGAIAEVGGTYILGGVSGSFPVSLVPADPQPGAWLGTSVALGDFDGDGHRDIASSAPRSPVSGLAAGVVHVFFGPFDQTPSELVLENPNPVDNGFFGMHLAAADGDGDGISELFVGAIGNTSGGLAKAGQVFVYPGPIDPAQFIVVEDPAQDPADLPSPRFGMHLQARAQWLLIGANRKDWVGVHDAGMGFSAQAPTYGPVTLHPWPRPRKSDYFGFRCVVADVIGDSALDLTYVLMGSPSQVNNNPRALVTWDGNDPQGPPADVRITRTGSADHFGNGLTFGQLVPGGKEELVVGDPSYNELRAGMQDLGRVVIYYY